MPVSRRDALLAGGLGLAGAAALTGSAQARTPAHSTSVSQHDGLAPGRPGTDYRPVVTLALRLARTVRVLSPQCVFQAKESRVLDRLGNQLRQVD